MPGKSLPSSNIKGVWDQSQRAKLPNKGIDGTARTISPFGVMASVLVDGKLFYAPWVLNNNYRNFISCIHFKSRVAPN